MTDLPLPRLAAFGAALDDPTVQWSLLLALAAAAGQVAQRHLGLPKVIGYSVVGAAAGMAGFPGVAWPLEGISLFLLQLGVAVVLFEAGGRLPLRWLRHHPMLLVQSLSEAALTFLLCGATLHWLGVSVPAAAALGAIAMVGSPAILSRVITDSRARGPVTERALALTTLGTLYALVLVSGHAAVLGEASGEGLLQGLSIGRVLGVSVAAGALLALAVRLALRMMSPTSENTAIVMISLLAATSALVVQAGGSGPLAALVGGLTLKQLYSRPWAWPGHMGTAASMLVMLNFVLVAVAAAQSDWTAGVAAAVAGLLLARGLGKGLGIALGCAGSGLRWRQSLGVAAALGPMSSVALLLVSELAQADPALGAQVAALALPSILLMQVLGAALAMAALHRAGESSRAIAALAQGDGSPVRQGAGLGRP
jgi:Kef-type K+ transport system membrane component KefB